MKYALLFICATPCAAGEFSILLDAWSAHSRGVWNEHNQTIGIEYVVERDGWHTILTAANYTDSLERDSWYSGAGFMYPLVTGSEWEITAGSYLLYFHHEAAPGPLLYTVEPDPLLGVGGFDVYGEVPKQAYIAPIPGLSGRYRNIGMNLAIIPPVNSYDPWTTALQLKVIF